MSLDTIHVRMYYKDTQISHIRTHVRTHTHDLKNVSNHSD